MKTLITLFPYIIAVIGVSSSVIVEFMRTKQRWKEKQLELYYENKLKAFKEFAESYSQLYENGTRNAFYSFSSKAYSAMLMAEPKTADKISELIEAVKSAGMRTNENTDCLFKECVKILNEYNALLNKS